MTVPRALLIPDIVEEIVNSAATVGTPKEVKRLLARLGRVSVIFRDPVVRPLWTEMTVLDPLFKLLANCEVIPGSRRYVEHEDEAQEPTPTAMLRLSVRATEIEDEIAAASRFRLVSGSVLLLLAVHVCPMSLMMISCLS